MRLRIRRVRQFQILPLAMAMCGLIILIIALPSWFLWALSGTGLLAGAWILSSRMKK